MATQTKPMTTREFAKASGIPAAAITKLIRDGKLKAQKEGNAWKIPPSQLDSKTVREFEKSAKAASPKKSSEAASAPQPPKASEPGPALLRLKLRRRKKPIPFRNSRP